MKVKTSNPTPISLIAIILIFLTSFFADDIQGQTFKKRTYANFQGVYRTGLFTLGAESVFGSISNNPLAADNSPKTASSIAIPLGLAGTASITQFLEFTTNGTHSTVRNIAAGTPV